MNVVDNMNSFWCVIGVEAVSAPSTPKQIRAMRYRVEGRPIVVSPHIKTFVTFNEITKKFDVHELSTGMRIASGTDIPNCIANTKQFFRQADEAFFFQQMRAMGPAESHPEMDANRAWSSILVSEQDAIKKQFAPSKYSKRS